MTAEEYLVKYALQHGYPVKKLREEATVVPCRCGLLGCQGWELVWNDDVPQPEAP